MSFNSFIQFALLLGVLLVLARPLGEYMGRVLSREPVFLDPVLKPVEHGLYRLAGIDADDRMDWKTYALAVLLFSLAGLILLVLLQRTQQWLPFNPQHLPAVPWGITWNTAISFVTNTNWQAYPGETTMSHLTQMLGLTVQNFLSAATGIAVLVALIRGLVRRTSNGLGNAWVDLIRGTLYVLLPLSAVIALLLVAQGTIQNLAAYVHTASGQVIAMGPVASQVAIKMLGTNGGGFFNANSAHPFENPNAISNLIHMLAIFAIPAALCLTFGKMVKDRRQGWAVLSAMTVIFVLALSVTTWAEAKGNAGLKNLPVDQVATLQQGGGNMEGKEVRFGTASTSLFATITTSASCGAINGWHDSFTPLGGLVPLWLIQLGEVVFGGVGSGLYGMLLFALVGVFIGGLMVGRTPEYLGKKIEAFEMKMASLAILLPSAAILIGTAAAVLSTTATASVSNPGPHGFAQILYAFSSASQNNGSAFGGLSVNIPFYNYGLAFAMLVGRFGVILPVLAIAGSLGRKKVTPESLGTLPTHTPLFVGVLVGVVLLVGALTYLPALALGPIAEQLALR